MKPMVVGICAHVDAGKTTLSEALLYQSGKIKTQGRVDHGNTVLDCDPLERQRGITITAKEAFFTWRDRDITLLDTPGHRDFSAMLEHTLSVLDAAVLLISACECNHYDSERIFRRLQDEHIPTIIFVNKMDIAALSPNEYMKVIQRIFGTRCVDFSRTGAIFYEELALCSDELLEVYLEKGTMDREQIAMAVHKREVIPVLFGSALKQSGIRELLDAMAELFIPSTYGSAFAARVYKITHDESGQRWTHLKITGGEISVKQTIGTEKIDQIRRCHGSAYELCSALPAGYVAAVKGLHHVAIGAGLGEEMARDQSLLSASFIYRVVSLQGFDGLTLMTKLKPLADEDPSLKLHYDGQWQEVQLSLRGKIQQEILIQRIQDRFALSVKLMPGRIAYRECILAPAEGVGHIERLKHYAEVHLLLEPLRRNAGVEVVSMCPSSMLDETRQQQLVAYLQEHLPPGIMSGSPLIDLRVTLVAVKTHVKHTDAQDLHEAALRAIRHGLKMGQCELLEPYVKYQLHCPSDCVGQAVYDLQQRAASYEISPADERHSLICGSGPLRTLCHYEEDIRTFTKGQEDFFMIDDGYRSVKQPQVICDEIGYEWKQDRDYPCDSYRLHHGVVTLIPYDQVYEHMDLPLQRKQVSATQPHNIHHQTTVSDEEVQRVTARLHHPRKQWKPRRCGTAAEAPSVPSSPQGKPPCLLVDGYNMIYAWPHLKELVKTAPDAAQSQLLAMLSNYQGYWNHPVIVVFDAYRTPLPQERILHDHQLTIIYTKSAQTADAYIEKTTHQLANEFSITVATSDAAEQNIILGQGAMRISARELYERIQQIHQRAMKHQKSQPAFRHMALEDLRQLNEEEKCDH